MTFTQTHTHTHTRNPQHKRTDNEIKERPSSTIFVQSLHEICSISRSFIDRFLRSSNHEHQPVQSADHMLCVENTLTTPNDEEDHH